jgi:hypothetical protein
MLLLVALAAAAPLDTVPPGVTSAEVLLCPWGDSCDPDITWVAGIRAEDFVPLDLLLDRDNDGYVGGVDTRSAVADALLRAEAAAGKGQWGAVGREVTAAQAALEQVQGDVNTQTLFTLWFLRGSAELARGADRGHEFSFRQAAAIAWDQKVKLPPNDTATLRAYQDESRKLVVGGTGNLVLAEPPTGTTYSLDGRVLGPGRQELTLLPGTHRVTAVQPGALHTWKAEVPVLPGRTVEVGATFSQADTARWVQGQLTLAFDTLQAPPEVTRFLSEWAARHALTQVVLLDVAASEPHPRVIDVHTSPADPMRPAAAAGERVDHGDGIPTTYEEQVLAEDEAAKARRPDGVERRLRIVYYDPVLQRFSTSPDPVPPPELAEPRFRVSVNLGYLGMAGRHHATADLGGAWRVGPISVEARLGLVRADAPYPLYPNWSDQQLYHVSLAARWAPHGDWAPFVTLGPEVYIPMAVGARLGAGVQAHLDRAWLGQLEAHGALSDEGLGWGIGLAIARGY